MPRTEIKPVEIKRARRLREQMTGPEKKLWAKLRAHRMLGAPFRRQVPIGNYVADFACHAAGLIIEVDGDQHYQGTMIIRDARRDAWFASQGYRTLRFSNAQVMNEFEGVILTIEAALTETLPPDQFATIPPQCEPSPLVGEGREGARAAATIPSNAYAQRAPSPSLPHEGVEGRKLSP